MRWQFSLRILLLVFVPLAAALACTLRTGKPQLMQTGNHFDLAIAGNGYFQLTDEFSANPRFARSGQLVVTAHNQLCLQVAGERLWLQPMITLPSDAESFHITADGRVLAMSGGGLLQQGQLEITIFPAQNLPVFEQPIFAADDETGPPIPASPGDHGSGLVQQGYRERRGFAWQREAFTTLLIGLVAGSLATAALLYR